MNLKYKNITQFIALLFTTLFIFSCQHQSAENNTEPNTLNSNIKSGDNTISVKKKRYEKPKEILRKEALLNIPYRSLDTSKIISTFAFGSCNDQNLAQPLWKLIKNKNPQVFLMMGDNVYASQSENKSINQPLLDQYIKLNENKDYLDLREATPFLATWDDHDYGQNDGGSYNPEKLEAKRIFLNYWSYLKNILPKDQNGIFHSRIVGDKKHRVQFIMLDTRFDRTPATDQNAKILSTEQWLWLESELKKPAELRILVSSIQVLANDHSFEKWGNFPNERKKILNLIDKTKNKNLVILSGDRQLASISKLHTGQHDLFDITSSSLNKPSNRTEPEVDSLYIGPSYLNINYGLAQIDWDNKQVIIQIIGEDDKAHLSQTIHF